LLTEEVHKERLKVITAVRNLVELDALVPDHIIKNNGDTSVKIPAEEFDQKCVTARVLLKEGHPKEQEFEKKRTQISLEAFGEPDSYINVGQAEAPKEESKK